MSASTAPGPEIMRLKTNICAAIVFGGLILAAGGCKSSGSGSSSGSRDPIFGGEKIPPQSLPVYGATKKDPLMKGATSTGRSEAMADPYRPSPSTTNAALAGAKSTPETDTLAYSKDRPRNEIVPVSASAMSEGGDFGERVRKAGGRMYAPVKLPSGEYEVRCAIPTGSSGTMRSYAAIGATQTSAMRELAVQVRADERR